MTQKRTFRNGCVYLLIIKKKSQQRAGGRIHSASKFLALQVLGPEFDTYYHVKEPDLMVLGDRVGLDGQIQACERP